MIFISGILIGGCSSEQDSKNEENPVVAQWDTLKLRQREFKREYVQFASRKPVQDNMESRRQFARQLMKRIIIASHGQQLQLDTLQEVRQNIEQRKRAALRKYHLRKEMDKRLEEPTESELYEAFTRSNSKLRLQQIYAPDEETINRYHKQLEAGAPFDSLARLSMRRAKQPDTAYRMGWVSWNEMDIAPEDTVFGLENGEISNPVNSFRGWHIFRLVNKKVTYHADLSSFSNSREYLKYNLNTRRFQEVSNRYIDSILVQHELVTHVGNLNKLWNEIKAFVPSKRDKMQLVQMRREALQFSSDQLPPDTPLANVDGETFTVAQFMERLPSIPMEYLRPNLRRALETAIKDSIMEARARKAGVQQSLAYRSDARRARHTALYYATLREVADTLELAPLQKKYYEQWKDRLFIDRVRTHYRGYRFADSLDADRVVQAFKKSGSWEKALHQHATLYTAVVDTAISQSGRRDPVHRLQITQTDEKGRRVLTGPYYRDGAWMLLEALERDFDYLSYEQAEGRIAERMQKQRAQITQQELYDKLTKSRDVDIELNEQALKEAYPFYYPE